MDDEQLTNYVLHLFQAYGVPGALARINALLARSYAPEVIAQLEHLLSESTEERIPYDE